MVKKFGELIQMQVCKNKFRKEEDVTTTKESPSVKKLKIPLIFEQGKSVVTLSPIQ
jgi:hypothetical protein